MSQHFYQSIANELERGKAVAIATVLQTGGSAPRSSGSRMLVRADGSIEGTIGGGNIEHRVIQDCVKAISDKKTRHLKLHLTRDVGMCCGGEMEVFIEPIEPNLDFVIFGAGHVAAALQPMLAAIDANITIVDDRLELASQERFPTGQILHEDGLQYAMEHKGGPNTYFLVVTHDHQRDQDIVEKLLPKTFAWLGLIGSRSKIAKFFIRYRAAGIDEALFSKINAPVGLDISAVTPGEIAIAIAAEVVSIRRNHKGPTQALSAVPIPARGGDGVARPPGLGPKKD